MLGNVVARVVAPALHTEPPRVFVELGRHPRLFRSWIPFAGTLLLRGDLPRADAELLILRTAVNCRCPYEWVQHASLARRAGLSDDEVVGASQRDVGAPLSRRQRQLLDAADELHDARGLSTSTRSMLDAMLTPRQVLELCMLVGHYEMLAMTINSLSIQPEPSALSRLSRRTGHVANALMQSDG